MLQKDMYLNGGGVSDPILVITNLPESVTEFDVVYSELGSDGSVSPALLEYLNVGQSLKIRINRIYPIGSYDVSIGGNSWDVICTLSDNSYNVNLSGSELNVLDKTKNAYAGIIASKNPNPWG